MNDTSEFNCTIYIDTTPEKLWEAITVPKITKQYWLHENVSDWKKHSKWHHADSNSNNAVRVAGTILEIIPNQLLVWTWTDPSDETDSSEVILNIKPVKDSVYLHVKHHKFKPGSKMIDGITEGWPQVLSSMKSFLETGRPLITWK